MASSSAVRRSGRRRKSRRKGSKDVIASISIGGQVTSSQMAPHFYDLTRARLAVYDLRVKGAHQTFLVNAFKVNIDPRASEQVSSYFEQKYGRERDLVRIDGQIELCYARFNEADQKFEYSSEYLSRPLDNQKCVIFALRLNAIRARMSSMSIGIYEMVSTRMRVEIEPRFVGGQPVSRYIQLFASRWDDEIPFFVWSSEREAAQINESIRWLKCNIFPTDIRRNLALSSLSVINGKHEPLVINDGGLGYEIRGIADALIVDTDRSSAMAVIELRKEPVLSDLRQLVMQMYACLRKSRQFEIFGILTDLDSDWYIAWFDRNETDGMTPVFYFQFHDAAPAIQCIRAMLCGNLRQNRDLMPKFIVFNDDDEDVDRGRLRGPQKIWRDTVQQQNRQTFNQSRPSYGDLTRYSRTGSGHETDEPLDAELYQALKDEGMWDVKLDFAEMPHADNPELQTKLLCEAMAKLDDLTDNEVMARMYEKIQSDRRMEEARAHEADRLAAERLRRMQVAV